jgi:peptide/nickel transport system ATP-binding protein
MARSSSAGLDLVRWTGDPDMTLIVENLQTHFPLSHGTIRAVDGVSFSVGRGKVLGLVGESGSGKTVTGFSILRLLDPPGEIVGGRILFDGMDLTRLAEDDMRKLRGRRIAMVFQDPMMALNPVLRIGTQMLETIQAHEPTTEEEARSRSIAALGRVGIPSPEERLAAYPHQLSGGMRQRVAIAIALLHRPDIIIADEPTTALDVTIQGQILHEMQRLIRETGTSMIWITHDLAVVSSLADEIAVMYAGRIVESGTVETVLTTPRHPYTRGLLDSIPDENPRGQPIRVIPGTTRSLKSLSPGCSFQPRCVRRADACAVMPDLIELEPGHAVRCIHPITLAESAAARAPAQQGCQQDAPGEGLTEASDVILSVEQVTKVFVRKVGIAGRIVNLLGADEKPEKVVAVDGVSFSIRRGEVVGLVGESGCGKSTLGRLVAGIAPLTGGSITYGDGAGEPRAIDAAHGGELGIQMVFQDPYASLNPRMRVAEIIAEAPLHHGLISPAESEHFVVDMMEQVGLDPALRRRYPHQFSGGQRQRVGIARALAINPKLLVCDEAIAALDVSIQAQILNMFVELRERLGLTYLFISHDLGVVKHIADRVLVMYLGRIVEAAPTQELFAAPSHPYTQSLLESVPRIRRGRAVFHPVSGEIPSPLNPPAGCHFHPRCPKAFDRCRTESPPLRAIAPERLSACHLDSVE